MASDGEPFGGQTLIADTSVWSVVPRAPAEVKTAWAEALRLQRIWTSPIVGLEWLHDARDSAQLEDRREHLDLLRCVTVSQRTCEAAIRAIAELARTHPPGYHRVSPGDALIAASAAGRGLAVLHYDHHFDKLAPALGFPSVWLAPPGTI
jgi:predicted nucleic acid-binding protein